MIFKKITILLCFLTTSLFSDIDLQKGIYDAAEEMMAFDEKMNRLIAEHNGVDYEKEEMSTIVDFEEKKDTYVLERNI